jgi:hypothetical protein
MGVFIYSVMPFGLKNAGVAFHRMMDKIFSKKIRKNMEVYINDMIIKTLEEKDPV